MQQRRLARVLQLTHRRGTPASPPPCYTAGRELRIALPNLARTLYNMAQCPAWGTHAAAFAEHDRLLADALAVLLPFLGTLAVGLRLPEDRRPHGCMWPAAGWTAGLAASAMFEDALDAWVAAADGAAQRR